MGSEDSLTTDMTRRTLPTAPKPDTSHLRLKPRVTARMPEHMRVARLLHKTGSAQEPMMSLGDVVYAKVSQCIGHEWDEASTDDTLRAAWRIVSYLPEKSQAVSTPWTLLEGGWRAWDALTTIADTTAELPSPHSVHTARRLCAQRARLAETGDLDYDPREDRPAITRATFDLARATVYVMAHSSPGNDHPALQEFSRELDKVDY